MKEAANTSSRVPLEQVRDLWNRRPCNIGHSSRPVGTLEYYEDVRNRKYFVEPHIPRFAQFERWTGGRVLEVGCGIGTDTISFAAAGASVVAVDLSERSLEIAQKRAALYGLGKQIPFVHADVGHFSESLNNEAWWPPDRPEQYD